MKCRNCGREVIKSSHPLHLSGYKHTIYPQWNCFVKRDKFSRQTVEPELFENYLKEIENEYPSS